LRKKVNAIAIKHAPAADKNGISQKSIPVALPEISFTKPANRGPKIPAKP